MRKKIIITAIIALFLHVGYQSRILWHHLFIEFSSIYSNSLIKPLPLGEGKKIVLKTNWNFVSKHHLLAFRLAAPRDERIDASEIIKSNLPIKLKVKVYRKKLFGFKKRLVLEREIKGTNNFRGYDFEDNSFGSKNHAILFKVLEKKLETGKYIFEIEDLTSNSIFPHKFKTGVRFLVFNELDC